MKMGRISVIVLMSVFTITSLCYAANEFQINGTVTTVNNNLITITDEKGKQINVEGGLSDLKSGDRVIVKGQIIKIENIPAELSTEDIDFLKQCYITQSDIDAIPKLMNDGKGSIFSAIKSKNCDQLNAFKISREYFKKMDINKVIPLAPAGWDIKYLTKEEFSQYTDLLENAPW